jgi:hypothetical protein
MFSEKLWKKIWLIFGVSFISVAIFMLLFAPMLASVVGTKPFSSRSRAMISFFWLWMIIYNGIGNILLYKNMKRYEILIILGIPAGFSFSILQTTYIAIGYFEFVFTEVMWAIIPLIWSLFNIVYLIDKKET